jgi:TolA-binding protein
MHPSQLNVTRQNVIAAFVGVTIVILLTALVVANRNSDDRTAVQQTTQENVGKQLDALREQLDQSETTRRQLTGDRERFQAQITASMEQLLNAGQQPIIVAPDAVPPEAKELVSTTTTPPPVVIPVPVPTPTSEPTTTTEVTNTSEVPSTEPPTTAPPVTTTTTTVPTEATTTTTTTTTTEVTP